MKRGKETASRSFEYTLKGDGYSNVVVASFATWPFVSIQGDGRGTGLEVIRRRVLESWADQRLAELHPWFGRRGCSENDQTIYSKIRSRVLEF